MLVDLKNETKKKHTSRDADASRASLLDGGSCRHRFDVVGGVAVAGIAVVVADSGGLMSL